MTKRDTEYQPLLEGITETKQKIKCPNTSLLLAICAACIGGTFQYGYNISIINSPTKALAFAFSHCIWGKSLQGHFVAPWRWGPLFSSLGASLLDSELLGKEEYWPILLSTTCIPAFLQLLILPWFPESPRYLLIDRGDDVGCGTAMKQLHGTDNFDREREDMERERISAMGIKPKKPWELFMDRSLRWQVLTIILINAAQQLNGINAIYFYTDYVFEEAGIPEVNIPYITVGTGACECLTALTCGMLIESLGRKVLIIGGYTLMAFWCICFTLTLTFQGAGPWIPYLSMGCVFAFILSFGMGPGGVTNILITELFTQTTRPAAYMIGGSVNWLSFFFIGMAFPFIVTKLQQYCFLVFLVVCVLVAVYIFLVVPETKNKTFLEIQTEFQSGEKRKASKADHSPSTTLLSTPL
ncbi:solute carrier family 2, facilitated glucose transporter member 11-like isoform X3 [Oncorhynchus clarkii lewisi]|uniref:solute carrier family 2, facilitated glucose transporter member 11-like isoform X3 n=1 Tax=Oncorhynchus clarkii lewisi TaxID=490388 RepID=UPI0039B93D94